MCGLVGVVGSDLSFQTNKIVKQLLYVDALRGPHSTGISMNTSTNEVLSYKRALASADFLQLDTPSKMLSQASGDYIMGHNRFATQGGINDENAHPFTYGNVTLAHNGTLDDKTTLPDYKDFTVDSENIAYAMGLADDPKEVITKLIGAFALTWYNDFQMKFYIVRNSERPMWIAKDKRLDNYYYASERYMLEMILTRNSVNYDIKELPVGVLLELDVKGPKVVKTHTSVKLAPKPKVHYGNYMKPYEYPNRSKHQGYVSPHIKLLEHHKMKTGDSLEFYSNGLPDLLPSHILGTLIGNTTQSKSLRVKAFAQPNDSLAGYYTGVLQSIVKDNGVDTAILRSPELLEIRENDPLNKGKGDQVSAVVSILKA